MPAFFPKSTLTVAFNGRKSPAFCPCRSTLGPINTSKICAEPGPMKRRDGYKVRQGDSALVDKEEQYAKMLAELRPKAEQADPYASFQSMETMLGNQRMEMHRLIHGYHDTAMRFLVRKEQSWRKAELEVKEMSVQLEAMKMPHDCSTSKKSYDKSGNKDSSNPVLLAQLERSREQLLDSEKSLRDVQSENFELREQLAAMQAVGAGYGKLLSPSGGSKDMRWMPPPEPEISEQKDSVAQFLEKLGTTSSNPLDRLERAQSKLEAWANSHHPKPDPVLAGLVDYQNMDLPNFIEEPEAQVTIAGLEEPTTKEEAEDENDGLSYVRSGKKNKKSAKNGRQTFSMKDKVADIFQVQMFTRDKYKKSGLAQKIVRSTHFENLCMFVIFLNAIWIGIDMSLNDAEVLAYADPPFIIVENLFCCFFFFEIVVRFVAFTRASMAFGDRWFVFDLALVVLMVAETWIMFLVVRISTDPSQSQEQAFDSSVLRLLKLVRITRVARIARLLRQVPEVMILLKGIGVASRSVFFTCLILLCVVYIFAIALTQLSEDTKLGQTYFPTLADGMFSLLFHGCFFQGLPDFAKLCFQENFMYGFSLLVFVVLAPLTVMNMIVGVLVEVVGIVAAAEQEASTRKSLLESLHKALEKLDLQMTATITKVEFCKIVNRPDIVTVFMEAGIDIVALLRDPDIVFAGDSDMNLDEFLEELITLRGANVATVKDLGQLKTQILREMKQRRGLR